MRVSIMHSFDIIDSKQVQGKVWTYFAQEVSDGWKSNYVPTYLSHIYVNDRSSVKVALCAPYVQALKVNLYIGEVIEDPLYWIRPKTDIKVGNIF